MKTHLLVALATSSFFASISPTFAQSTAAEFVDQQSAAQDTVHTRRSRASQDDVGATTGMAPAIAAPSASSGRPFDAMIASHAAANGIPPEIVHRVVMRESRYRASAVGRGGASGLMQIKLATARSMGYSGSAAGLLDPETNLTYGVRYLAGAYRAAHGHHGRALGYYASGYHGAARPARTYAVAPTHPALFTTASAEAEPVALMERPMGRKHRHHRHR